MSRTTIEMAREAAGDDWKLFQEYMPEIHRLAELIRADEREACAKVCEERIEFWQLDDGRRYEDEYCANAIRARSNT